MVKEAIGNLNEALGTVREQIQSSNAERQQWASQLDEIISTAQQLRASLGGEPAPAGKRRGRPAGSGKRGPGRPKGSGGKKKRTMSAEARAAISAAQKARWAKQKAGKKK